MKRNSVRRTFMATTVAGLLALAAACGGGPSGPNAKPTGNGNVKKSVSGSLHVLMEQVPDTDIVKNLLPEFNKVYPNVHVKIDAIVYDQIRDKVVASSTAPKPTYNLAIVDNPWMGDFAKAGFLKPLDSYVKTTSGYDYGDFAPPLRQIGTVGGHIYGVPFYNYGLGLIYRQDQLAQPPTALNGLAADAAKLNTASEAGIAMQPQRGYKAFEEWGNYLFAAGGSIYGSDGKVNLETPQAKTALNTYIKMYHSSAPKNSLNWAFDDAERSVSSGKSAMMVSYNWMLPTLNKRGAGPLAGKFALASMPGGKQILGLWDWAIPANSNTSDADWAFISWLTSKAGEKTRVIAGGAPTRNSVLTDPEVAKKGYGAAYYKTVGQILANSAPLCTGANCDEMIQAVGTELNAAVAGQKSINDALTTATTKANKIQAN